MSISFAFVADIDICSGLVYLITTKLTSIVQLAGPALARFTWTLTFWHVLGVRHRPQRDYFWRCEFWVHCDEMMRLGTYVKTNKHQTQKKLLAALLFWCCVALRGITPAKNIYPKLAHFEFLNFPCPDGVKMCVEVHLGYKTHENGYIGNLEHLPLNFSQN